jgi:hypothetical protein
MFGTNRILCTLLAGEGMVVSNVSPKNKMHQAKKFKRVALLIF